MKKLALKARTLRLLNGPQINANKGRSNNSCEQVAKCIQSKIHR